MIVKKLLLLLFFFTALHVNAAGVKTKKIVIDKFLDANDAKALRSELEQTYYIKTICDKYLLELVTEETAGRYLVVLKPFRNETLLSAVFAKLRKRSPHAYIKKYFDTTPGVPAYVLGPMPEKKTAPAAKVVAPPKPKVEKVEIAKELTQSSSSSEVALTAEESMPYLRSNVQNAAPDTVDVLNWLWMGAVVLLVGIVGILLFMRKKKPHKESRIDEYLMGPALANKSDALSPEKSINSLRVDLHSHLIPGIDDGSKSMEESIAMVRKLKELGYRKLITTPHIMSHRYPNTSETITEGFLALQRELDGLGIEITMEVAAEYYLDDHFLSLLKKRDLLTFGSNFLLFEMSYVNHPANLFEIVEAMKEAGYKPVLAHPERYLFMHKDFEKYEKLKKTGLYFQLNLNSLAGYYSTEVQSVAKELVQRGMIDFLGSDSHKIRQILTLESVLDSREFQEIFAKNTILNNML